MLKLATLSHMTTHDAAPDWTIAYRILVHEAQYRHAWTRDELSQKSRIHRATLDRMRKGEAISEDNLSRLEGTLGLPRGLLSYAARRDLEAIKAALPDNLDLVRWLTGELGGKGREYA